MSEHTFSTSLTWSGSTGVGDDDYSREHHLTVAGTGTRASSDVAFGGDAGLPNPEQLLVEVAHRECFIAQSLRSEIVLEPVLVGAD